MPFFVPKRVLDSLDKLVDNLTGQLASQAEAASLERAEHRLEVRSLLARAGAPVPVLAHAPAAPAPEPRGRWVPDPEGYGDPIFVPEEDTFQE